MIRSYYHPTPNPAKIALFLEETELAYEVIPVDTARGEQHASSFRAINPNGKVPAIIDTDGPGGSQVRVFDSTAILIYLAEKTGQLLGPGVSRAKGERRSTWRLSQPQAPFRNDQYKTCCPAGAARWQGLRFQDRA